MCVVCVCCVCVCAVQLACLCSALCPSWRQLHFPSAPNIWCLGLRTHALSAQQGNSQSSCSQSHTVRTISFQILYPLHFHLLSSLSHGNHIVQLRTLQDLLFNPIQVALQRLSIFLHTLKSHFTCILF